jgi:metallo-beta-lactamase class B
MLGSAGAAAQIAPGRGENDPAEPVRIAENLFYVGGFGDTAPFPAAAVDRRLKDGDQVRVGDAILTARVTPGHTKGCTTWTFDARDRDRTYHVVVVCGLSILSNTRLSGMPSYPGIAADYERTFDVLKRLPCDIFLGAHASYFGGMEKAARRPSSVQSPVPSPQSPASSPGSVHHAQAYASTRGSAPALNTPVAGSMMMPAFDP